MRPAIIPLIEKAVIIGTEILSAFLSLSSEKAFFLILEHPRTTVIAQNKIIKKSSKKKNNKSNFKVCNKCIKVSTRSPLDFNLEVLDIENNLQIHFQSPLHDAEITVKDSNGNLLADGDDVLLIKDLKLKGSSEVLKKGTKFKNIRLVNGDHNVDCGKIMLKSEFLKKA